MMGTSAPDTLDAALPSTLPGTAPGMALGILGAISLTHAINDMMQSVLLALYPVFQGRFQLSFMQIGLVTLMFQFSASLLQPVIGHLTDRRPKPYSLPVGMGFTLLGLVLLALAGNYLMVLLAAVLVGIGSSIFHPESSRIARLASAGQHGLAQSIFQMGGTAGTALGPLLAAAVILPLGQISVLGVSLLALLGIAILRRVGRWYAVHLSQATRQAGTTPPRPQPITAQARLALFLLVLLLISKFVYVASLNSYFTFYLMEHFRLNVQVSQYCLFIFLFGSALGTLIGGPIGDRIGRKRIILASILGAAPFTLILPHVGLLATLVLVFVIGLIISSAFPAIVVYGQELMPGRVGAVSGLFFGLAFGIGGIGAALIGALADWHGIEMVYQLCAYLPLLGLVAFLLPDMAPHQLHQSEQPERPE